jgi:hypothetical protein
VRRRIQVRRRINVSSSCEETYEEEDTCILLL